MKDKIKELEELKKKVKTPEFIEVINKKIDKLKGDKTINKDGY